MLSARGLLDSMPTPKPWASLVAQTVKNLPAMQEPRVMRMYIANICVSSQVTYLVLSSLLPWQVGTEDTPSKINPKRYGLWFGVLLGNLLSASLVLSYLIPLSAVCGPSLLSLWRLFCRFKSKLSDLTVQVKESKSHGCISHQPTQG